MNTLVMTKTPALPLEPLHHWRRAKEELAVACDAINSVSLHYSLGPLCLVRREARAFGLNTDDLDILIGGLVEMVKVVNGVQIRLDDMLKRVSIAAQ